MTIWPDARLSPALATWISETFDVACRPVREIGLRDATDGQALSCREAGRVLVTDNERDFQRICRYVQFDFVRPWPGGLAP